MSKPLNELLKKINPDVVRAAKSDSVFAVVERFDTENVFLPIPDEILEKLGAVVGDEFHVAVVQPNCIVLTKCPGESDTKTR